MKTEREMFKKAYLNLMSGDSLPFPDAVFDEYVKLRTENGYKLVPLQPPNEVIVAIEKKVENQLEASGINQDPFRLDGETIYEAMIGVPE